MLELLFSALITILPDYLYRRYKQGKRLGHEINLFTVWYELRWGITSCAVLAISLLTVIFYFHPTTTNVTSLFRTVSILSDRPGRVEEVYVADNQFIRVGAPIFRLDTQRQQAAAETARRRIAEVEAAILVGKAELAAAEGNIIASESQLRQAQERADALQSDAERKHSEIMGTINQQRGVLEGGNGGQSAAPIFKQISGWLLNRENVPLSPPAEPYPLQGQ